MGLQAAIKTHVRAVLSHGRPIQSPTQIMIADMTMTVRSMVSHWGTRVVGLVMVCILLHSFERERAQSRMT